MRPRWSRGWVLVLVILLVIVGLSYYYLQREMPREIATAVPRQSVIGVSRGDLYRAVSSTGSITADRDLELAFDVGGRVKQVYAEVTETVREGTVLVELDRTRQELAYLSAKRELELARFEASPSVLKEKELAFQVANAELEATKLTAPFAGLIATSNVQKDEWVSSGTVIMRLLDTSRLFLDVSVDEIDIRHVHVGQDAMVSVDAYPELKLMGKVVEVGIVPDSQGQIVVFPVRIEVMDPDPRVRVGMSGEAEVVVEKAEKAIIVPFEAVMENRNQHSVAVVKGDEVETVPVVIGLSDGFSVEIIDGLDEGEQIVVGNPAIYRSLQGTNGGQRGGQTPFGPGFLGGIRR